MKRRTAKMMLAEMLSLTVVLNLCAATVNRPLENTDVYITIHNISKITVVSNINFSTVTLNEQVTKRLNTTVFPFKNGNKSEVKDFAVFNSSSILLSTFGVWSFEFRSLIHFVLIFIQDAGAASHPLRKSPSHFLGPRSSQDPGAANHPQRTSPTHSLRPRSNQSPSEEEDPGTASHLRRKRTKEHPDTIVTSDFPCPLIQGRNGKTSMQKYIQHKKQDITRI
ncbi:hypothetical protein STEG23_020341 [Scotinomys teguina]